MSRISVQIATAKSRLAKRWKNQTIDWDALVSKCSQTFRTKERVSEYARMSKQEQSEIKDVGGFVGGYLQGGIRKTECVQFRTVATLDIDYGTTDVWEDFTMAYDFAAILYSTHKHTPEKPRYRLVFPLSRSVSPDEYEPLCRRIAAEIGIDLFDQTTYQLARLFYWPSTSRDGEFVFKSQDGSACDVDKVLSTYTNYKDASEWPTSSREGDVLLHEMKRAGEPTEKPGLIGAFCRAYSIEDVIEVFLHDYYEPTTMPGRYTYKHGSVAGGLVCYDNKFAYSHHETDPCSLQLCNAFDLVRIHLYGAEDEGSRANDITHRPSYQKMSEFVAKDKRVRQLLTEEKQSQASTDFAEVKAEADSTWKQELEYTGKGQIKSSAYNIMQILEHDPQLAGHIWTDEFSGFDIVTGGLPWNKTAKQWGNRDDANLRVYLEQCYGITGKDKIKDAKDAVLTKYRRHPIREYLNTLEWDGTPRLERLIIDYIGAEDNALNRAMTRKHFTAAVARVMHPGCKYDYCLIVAGAEGIGKSTLFSVMGGEWFNDSLVTTEGKTGMEQLRSGWIIELAELSSVKHSDVEQVKNYISRQHDIYRAAYGTVVERHPRQCVFCGTTNETHFLKGDAGNRRFWVIQAQPELCKYENPRDTLINDRNQLWAEAVALYKQGEPLYLSNDMELEARERQKIYNDNADDPMRTMLEDFLEMELPADWYSWNLQRRRAYLNNPDPLDPDGVMRRQKVCAAEFICERLGVDMRDKNYKYLARKVCNLIREQENWEQSDTTWQTIYGRQRYFFLPQIQLH